MKPYRCLECQARFYLPGRLAQKIDADRAWVHHVLEEENSRQSDYRKTKRKRRT